MALTWTDWRGNDYTVGDTVLYARMDGRSCEMAEGIVTDLYEVYRDDSWKWVRVPEGEPVPEYLGWKFVNPENPAEYSAYRHEGWERREIMTPYESERRAKVMPTLRTSRFRESYAARTSKYVWDEAAGTGKFVDTGPRKPVTLTVTESITAIVP